MRRSEAQKPKTFRTLLFDEGPPEAQKPKTFRIAASYAQKLSRRSARNRFHDKTKKSTFASYDIDKECIMNVLAQPPLWTGLPRMAEMTVRIGIFW